MWNMSYGALFSFSLWELRASCLEWIVTVHTLFSVIYIYTISNVVNLWNAVQTKSRISNVPHRSSTIENFVQFSKFEIYVYSRFSTSNWVTDTAEWLSSNLHQEDINKTYSESFLPKKSNTAAKTQNYWFGMTIPCICLLILSSHTLTKNKL